MSGAGASHEREPFLGIPRGEHVMPLTVLFVGTAVAFLVLYGGASWLSGYVPWRIEVHFAFEPGLPFWPETSLVYLSMDLILAMAPFVLRTWPALLPLAAALVLEMLVGGAFFILLPVETAFPPRIVEGWPAGFFAAADTLNMERNFLPSLHVAFAFTAAAAYAPNARTAIGRAGLYVWAVLIAISTVTIHEHHLLDVFAGMGVAWACWRLAREWAERPDVLDAWDVEFLCLSDAIAFARRHRRYVIIDLALIKASLPRWRERRLLRTGFCFLQHVDDLLDDDRACEGEPLDVVQVAADRIRNDDWAPHDNPGRLPPLERLAKAFATDLRAAGGQPAVDDALELIAVMQADRARVLEGGLLSTDDLRDQLRRTFVYSIDVMLLAGGFELRAADVPDLVEAFSWCSTVRDLDEDLSRGLINIPTEVVRRAEEQGAASLSHDALVATDAVRTWMSAELAKARAHLDAAEARITSLKGTPGVPVLDMFTRSIRKWATSRAPARYPFLA